VLIGDALAAFNSAAVVNMPEEEDEEDMSLRT